MARQWRWKMAVVAALTGGSFSVFGGEVARNQRADEGWQTSWKQAHAAQSADRIQLPAPEQEIAQVAYPVTQPCPPACNVCPPAATMTRPAAPGSSMPSASAPSAPTNANLADPNAQINSNFSPDAGNFDLGGMASAASSNAAVAPNMLGDFFGMQSIAVINGIRTNAPQPGQQIARFKMAENTNPLPQDRVYFNYHRFSDVFNSFDVNRYTFGVEKTLLDGLASIELRVPLANSLASTSQAGVISEDTDIGNIIVTAKSLLYSNCHWNIAAGVGLQTPTADDTRIFEGQRLAMRIKNEAYHILPFIGSVWTPNDRWVVQGYAQLDFDANGNPISTDDGNSFAATGNGRLNSQNLLFLSTSIGYHLFRNPCLDGWINQITPMAELHWSKTIQDADTFTAGGVSVGSADDDLSSTNLTLGSMMLLGRNSMLSLGWVTPLTSGNDRQFDWEAQAQLNIRYGRSKM